MGIFETLIAEFVSGEGFGGGGGLEYLDFFPGMEGRDGAEGVPVDLNVSTVASEEEGLAVCVMFSMAVKRRVRRISASISSWARRRCSNFSELVLPQRENLTSVEGR